MVIDCGGHKFLVPSKAVRSPADIAAWEKSEAYQDILGFMTSMNSAVRGKKLSSECEVSPVITSLLEMLNTLSEWIDDIIPVDQPQRYGNKAFKDFYDKLKQNGETIVKKALPEKYHAAVPEITVYLVESVGNSTRIDYGTGHELAFIMFLTCVFKIGALEQKDSVATVTKVFKRYLDLARKLQMTYKMEPAGSQGVWSLDDYQFVPFIWGSSQLHMHPKISPEMFCSEKVVEENADENLFLSCIKFILSVKTGPFAEHSNQLWNISAVHSWTKINQGLFKMYKAEILSKFPIIQHVLFGSILTMSPAAEIKYPGSGSELPGMRRPMGSMPAPCSAGRFPAPGGMTVLEGKFPTPGCMPGAESKFPISSAIPMAETRFPTVIGIPMNDKPPTYAQAMSERESSSSLHTDAQKLNQSSLLSNEDTNKT